MDKSTGAEAAVTSRGGLRKRQRNFNVPLPSTTARLTCISYRALGVHAFLLDQADGWDVRAEQLANDGKRADGTGADGAPHMREGREAIRTVLWELAAAGLYRLERRQCPDGKFKMGTAISDVPIEAWAAQAAIFGDKAIPVVEKRDGTFLVRYPNGVLLPEDEMPPADLERQPAKAKKPRKAPRRGTATRADTDDDAPAGPAGSNPPDTRQSSGVQSLGPGSPGPKKPESGKAESGYASPLVTTSIRPNHEVGTDQPSVDQLGVTDSEQPFEQPTLDGSVPGQRHARDDGAGEQTGGKAGGKGKAGGEAAETPRDLAFGVGRAWIAFREREKRPVVMAGRHADAALHALAKLIEPWLNAGYTDVECKHALNLADVGVPSQQQFERAIDQVRHGRSQNRGAGPQRRQRPAGGVNGAWAHVRPTADAGTTGGPQW